MEITKKKKRTDKKLNELYFKKNFVPISWNCYILRNHWKPKQPKLKSPTTNELICIPGVLIVYGTGHISNMVNKTVIWYPQKRLLTKKPSKSYSGPDQKLQLAWWFQLGFHVLWFLAYFVPIFSASQICVFVPFLIEMDGILSDLGNCDRWLCHV